MAVNNNLNQNISHGTGQRCNSNEATSLLCTSLSELDTTIANSDTSEPYLKAAKREFNWIVSASFLTTTTLLLEFSFHTANVLVVGHLGAKKLGAISLSMTFQVIVAMAPTFGLVSAMGTFCSTAYTASQDKILVGFHFQRGIIAVCAHSVLAAALLWNSEACLLLLRIDPVIASLSGQYLRIQLLSLLPFSLFEATKHYLQAQGIMHAATVITMVVAPIHWIICYTFVLSPKYGIGFVAAPITSVVSNCMLLAGMLVYVSNSRVTESWGGWDAGAFRNMSAFYSLAILSVITTCASWISFELLGIGASYFGANQLAGSAIMLNVLVIVYRASTGIGFGASPRIGNLIGAAKPRQARISAIVTLLMTTFTTSIGSLFMALYCDWWIPMYTDNPDVAHETTKLIPVACVLTISGCLGNVMAAILRGLGRQKVSANSFLFGFGVSALPVAIYLEYIKHMESIGLWWGTCAGALFALTVQIIYFYFFIDWKDEVRICLLRLKNNSGSTTEPSS